jgi:hypothetical protein
MLVFICQLGLATGAKTFNRSLPPQQQQKTVLGIVINTEIAAFTVDSDLLF